ncbi:MAG: DUF1287 domain-containing protein [Verrucomicrobiaceae bacterium]
MRHNPIEYVGAAPMKKKRRNPLGGWLLVAFALILGGVFLRPLLPFLQAQQDLTSAGNLTEALENLESDGRFGSLLAAQALLRTKAELTYDEAYYTIDFPNGDVPADKGNRADVVVRAYRGVGIDLQEEVNEDMTKNFRLYPQIYRRKGADSNIDHRLVNNLERFFSRKGESYPVSNNEDPLDYNVGDIVIWRLADAQKHIGIVVPGPGAKKTEKWIVHNMIGSPVWEDRLLDYKIIGHYRYAK